MAKDGYGVTASAIGDSALIRAGLRDNTGYHGYIATNPKMNAAFITAGAGIKRGMKVGMIENVDVAPTIAHLLHERLEGADGKVMSVILE